MADGPCFIGVAKAFVDTSSGKNILLIIYPKTSSH